MGDFINPICNSQVPDDLPIGLGVLDGSLPEGPRTVDSGLLLHAIGVNSIVHLDSNTVALNHFSDVSHPNLSGKIHRELKVRGTFLETFLKLPSGVNSTGELMELL